ncbi:MAG TPA: hypothetical protein VNT30_23355 [Stellaceae bacterium]|nr:hypothetical protein [Stellaceae bacterium]
MARLFADQPQDDEAQFAVIERAVPSTPSTAAPSVAMRPPVSAIGVAVRHRFVPREAAAMAASVILMGMVAVPVWMVIVMMKQDILR